MSVLIWKHEHTPDMVRRLIQSRLDTAGIGDRVSWNGYSFSSSVGWGTILNLQGEITSDEIILNKASGALGPTVLAKSREAFQELFPNGEQSLVDDSAHAGVA